MSEEKQNRDSGLQANTDSNNQSITDFGVSSIKNSRGNIQCLTVVGQIEGHMMLPPQNKTTKYEHILPLLVAVEKDEETDGLIILLNTVGGDVEAGLAISEMVSGMKKPTVSLVLGGGHSIGVPLAVCAKHSFIVPSATMTIHPIRMSGTVIGVPQTYEYFNKMQERVVDFVVRNSSVKKKKFTELMMRTGEIANDVGSIILGKEAVDIGLIDEIGGIDEALRCLYKQIDEIKNTNNKENREDKKGGKGTDSRNNGKNGD
ncbi:MAG: translocation-enhancing protein TepA [Ruminococcaceae bacterium]|nr:translocation-enhancing protein TepA [Oscillospiraceae bacterium]